MVNRDHSSDMSSKGSNISSLVMPPHVGVIMAFWSCHSSGIYGFRVLSAQCYGTSSGVTARKNSDTKMQFFLSRAVANCKSV